MAEAQTLLKKFKKNSYLLVYFSKCAKIWFYSNATTVAAIRFLDEMFSREKFLSGLVIDYGS